MDKYITELIKATDLFGKVNTKIAKLPNPYILTYILEAIDSISSNEIENIHTTIDEGFEGVVTHTETPYYNYREALKGAHKNLIASELILARDIKSINKRIRGQDGEYRKNFVSIKDSKGNVVHKPISADQIPHKMDELINMINQNRTKNQILNALDIHHFFEYIHPFSDGNGRTGRILFALLLSKYEILDVPVSIFSYSLAKSKNEYYEALKEADKGNINTYYEKMLIMLNDSLMITLSFIDSISKAMKEYEFENEKKTIIAKFLFYSMKTTNRWLVKKTGFNNKTISKYVDELETEGLIIKERKSKYVLYKNVVLESIIKNKFTNLK